jgi:putative nucleotidyltransferase with HDIG domain
LPYYPLPTTIHIEPDLFDIGLNAKPISLTISEFKELARMFSRIVDAKTPFTDAHSQFVAKISKQLASEFGLKGLELEYIEIAGLLHDIGKLRVSEDILEKSGSLSAEERASMHRHSYDTFRFLNRVFEGTKIPIWAGFHHETLIGSGYPFGSSSSELDLECQIIAVADIFQALAQDRPYRTKWTLEMIIENMQKRVASGSLDSEVVTKLTEQSEKYYKLATQKDL